MTDESPNRAVMSRVALLVTLTQVSLAAERLWSALWPALAMALAVAGVLWSGVLSTAPAAALVMLVVALVGIARLAWRGLRYLRLPPLHDSLQALEARGGVPGRPVSMLIDDPVLGQGPLAASLWARAQRRAAEAVSRLRVPGPRSDMAVRDRWGLANIALLVAVLGGAAGGSDGLTNVLATIRAPLVLVQGAPPALTVTITPPEHTGRPTVLLEATGGTGPAPTVPEGSTITAHLSGGTTGSWLRLGETEVAFTPDQELGLPKASLVVVGTATGPQVVEVSLSWLTTLRWPIVVADDAPPHVAWSGMPEPTSRSYLRLPLKVSDDHGIAKLSLRLIHDHDPDRSGGDVAVPLSRLPGGEHEVTPAVDLTGHRWAGRRALLRVTVEDALGQQATTPPEPVLLPERTFTHPVAKELAAVRRDLIAVAEEPARFGMGSWRDVKPRLLLSGRSLRRLLNDPEAYANDTVVSLGLAVLYRRLEAVTPDVAMAALDTVIDTLWPLALRVESGDLSNAEAQLARAEQALADALAEGADARTIRALTDALRLAVGQYLRELTRSMSGDSLPEGVPVEGSGVRSLAQTLRDLDTMSQAGAHEAAEALMRQLRGQLDALRHAEVRRVDPDTLEQMNRAAQALRDVTQAQRDLRDQTFREQEGQEQPSRAQEGQAKPEQSGPSQPGARGAGLATAQEEVRRQLGAAMAAVGALAESIPDSLGQAEQHMRAAEGHLRSGNLEAAGRSQDQALDALSRGMGEAGSSMAQQALGGALGLMLGGGASAGPGADPLGRRLGTQGGLGADETVKIPGAGALGEAHKLRETIRSRANDPDRSVSERRYLERLMRPF